MSNQGGEQHLKMVLGKQNRKSSVCAVGSRRMGAGGGGSAEKAFSFFPWTERICRAGVRDVADGVSSFISSFRDSTSQ